MKQAREHNGIEWLVTSAETSRGRVEIRAPAGNGPSHITGYVLNAAGRGGARNPVSTIEWIVPAMEEDVEAQPLLAFGCQLTVNDMRAIVRAVAAARWGPG